MIRFGPGGIPLSCKGRTLRDGLEDIHILGLTAMEVQLVRMNVTDRYVMEEEVGLKAKDFPNDIIVGASREGKKDWEEVPLNQPVKEGDVVTVLSSGLVKNYDELRELGTMAKELDIQLNLHTPYYMDLCSKGDDAFRSIDNIRWGAIIANEMGGGVVVTHLGLYCQKPKDSKKSAIKNVSVLVDWIKENNLKVKVGLETSGKQEVFGTMDELIGVCEKVNVKKKPDVIPVLNFAHIHSRAEGSLKKKEDFQEVFDSLKGIQTNDFYTHFAGVEHEGGNEKRYTPIKKGDLRFDPLASCILDNNFDITVISSSPLLEHDAMYMKVIMERILTRREAKRIRQLKKGKEGENAEDEKDD